MGNKETSGLTFQHTGESQWGAYEASTESKKKETCGKGERDMLGPPV